MDLELVVLKIPEINEQKLKKTGGDKIEFESPT